MSDTELGPFVTMELINRDGTKELGIFPALLAGALLFENAETAYYYKIKIVLIQPDEFRIERSMTEWVRSI